MRNNMLVNIIYATSQVLILLVLIKHQQQNCWTNCLINLVHSCLQSFGTWNGIMLDAFGYLLCF